MNIANIIRKGIATADKFTGGPGGVQDQIQIFRWIGNDDYGQNIYRGIPLIQDAIVEEKERRRVLSNGQEVTQKAEITIPRPISSLGGIVDRREPLDPRDKIILPSGYSGPILDVSGLTDPKTHNPFMITVILG